MREENKANTRRRRSKAGPPEGAELPAGPELAGAAPAPEGPELAAASGPAPAAGGDPVGLVTRAQAAAALGVAPARINRWVEDGAPVAVRGRRGHSAMYDLAALRAWKARRSRGPRDELSLSVERAKLARVQRERWTLEVRFRKGELLEREAVVAEGRTHVAAAKTRLRNVPRQAVNLGIIPAAQEPALRRLIDDALRELAAWRTLEAGRPSAGAAPEEVPA